MNESETNMGQRSEEILSLARAVRFALVIIVLGISYLNLRASLMISNVVQMGVEISGGNSLPKLMQLISEARHFFVAFGVIIPVAAIATFFIRNVVASIYWAGVLGFIAIMEIIVLYHGVVAYLVSYIGGMSS